MLGCDHNRIGILPHPTLSAFLDIKQPFFKDVHIAE
jgi:hypothetical protein